MRSEGEKKQGGSQNEPRSQKESVSLAQHGRWAGKRTGASRSGGRGGEEECGLRQYETEWRHDTHRETYVGSQGLEHTENEAEILPQQI